MEQDRFHLPDTVTYSSGGLPGLDMYTKLPLPLVKTFVGSLETPCSKPITGLSHLSLFPDMSVVLSG